MTLASFRQVLRLLWLACMSQKLEATTTKLLFLGHELFVVRNLLRDLHAQLACTPYLCEMQLPFASYLLVMYRDRGQ